MDNKREHAWHTLTNAELAREFRSDCAIGLKEQEARRRLRHGKNNIWYQKTVSVKKYVATSMIDFTTIMLILTVAAAAFFGRSDEALAVCMILMGARAARVALYIYAQRTLEENASYSLPRARVVRNGNVREISAKDVVVGDVIILDAGDTVPCDMRLTAADNVLVTEAGITDKDGVIQKNSLQMRVGPNVDVPLYMRSNMLYGTSTVVGGFGIGMAVATGKDTLICKREGGIEIQGGEEIPVLDKLNDWSRICSLSLVIAALLISGLGITIGNHSFFGIFLPCIAMAAACLSEFISAVGALTAAVSLRKKKTDSEVFKNISTAETCAKCDALVFRSAEVLKSRKISLHSYFEDTKLKLMGTKDAVNPNKLLALACYCTGMSPSGSISRGTFGKAVRQTSVVSHDVIRALWEEHGTKEDDPHYTIAGHITAGEIDSDNFDCVLLAKENKFFFAISGRSEAVLDRCISFRKDGKERSLTKEAKKQIESYIEALKNHGVTTCAIAMRPSQYNSMRRVSVLRTNLCFEGFIAVTARMEPDTVDLLNKFREDGGRVLIFSDQTVARVDEDKYFCTAEGVFKTGDTYIGEKESPKVNGISTDAGTLTMIRTQSGSDGIKERLRFVNMLREAGLKYMYVGYGVEDMWNLQKADVAVAVPGVGGTAIPQVLRNEADGVCGMGHGGFFSSFKMILSCRSILNKIRNILSYLIMSQAARLVLMIICAVASFPVMNSLYMVFWGAVLDFAVVAAMGCVPNKTEYLERKECLLPDDAGDVLYPTMYGALLAAASCGAPFFGRAIIGWAGRETVINSNQMVLCMFVSCMLAMPFLAAEYAGGFGLFSSKSKYGKLFVIPFVTAVVGIAVALWSPITEVEFPGWMMVASTVLPVLFVTVTMSVVRATKENKEIKKNK